MPFWAHPALAYHMSPLNSTGARMLPGAEKSNLRKTNNGIIGGFTSKSSSYLKSPCGRHQNMICVDTVQYTLIYLNIHFIYICLTLGGSEEGPRPNAQGGGCLALKGGGW